MKQFTALWLALLFVAGMWPLAGDFVFQHPDERHYTDGAINMLRHGDWITPRTAEGDLRLLKPGVTYWLTAGGLKLLGYNPLGARAAFILCGGLIVALTYGLGLVLLEDRRGALLAGLMAMVNPLVILGAGYSIPEVALTACLTASLLGFAGLLLKGRPTVTNQVLAWGGVGLAVGTKGLLAAILVGYVLAFAAWLGWQHRNRVAGDGVVPEAGGEHLPRGVGAGLRQVLHPGAVLLGLVIGGAWYGLIIWQHGWGALTSFWGDQVGEKVSQHSFTRVLVTAGGLVGIYLATLVPWCLLGVDCLWRARREQRAATPASRRLRQFAMGWAVLLVAVFSLAPMLCPRYVMAAVPLLAVMLADTFRGEPDQAWLDRRVRRGVVITGVGLLLLGLLLGVVGYQLTSWPRATGLALGFALVGGAIILAGRKPRRVAGSTLLAGSVGVLVVLAALALRPMALPDQGRQVATRIVELHLPTDQPILVRGKRAVAAKLRLFLAATDYRVQVLDGAEPAPPGAVLLLRSADAAELPPGAYQTFEAASGFRDLPPVELLRAALGGRLKSFLESHLQHWLLAVPRDEAGKPATSPGGP